MNTTNPEQKCDHASFVVFIINANLGENISIFINKLFEIDFETNVSDKSFIEEQRFEAIIASLSSSNNKYR